MDRYIQTLFNVLENLCYVALLIVAGVLFTHDDPRDIFAGITVVVFVLFRVYPVITRNLPWDY